MTLIHVHQRHVGDRAPEGVLTLPYDQRQKSRLRATLDDGRQVAVVLQRGESLKHGDLLQTTDGRVLVVHAKAESVSVIRSSDPLLLSRAAYHLGNRHMPLQIGSGQLCYPHDHVLDDMLRQLGLEPSCEQAPFEPESGAYGHGHQFAAHRHAHQHAHHSAHPPADHPAHQQGSPGHEGHTHSHAAASHAAAPAHGSSRQMSYGAGKIHTHWDDDEPAPVPSGQDQQ